MCVCACEWCLCMIMIMMLLLYIGFNMIKQLYMLLVLVFPGQSHSLDPARFNDTNL